MHLISKSHSVSLAPLKSVAPFRTETNPLYPQKEVYFMTRNPRIYPTCGHFLLISFHIFIPCDASIWSFVKSALSVHQRTNISSCFVFCLSGARFAQNREIGAAKDGNRLTAEGLRPSDVFSCYLSPNSSVRWYKHTRVVMTSQFRL